MESRPVVQDIPESAPEDTAAEQTSDNAATAAPAESAPASTPSNTATADSEPAPVEDVAPQALATPSEDPVEEAPAADAPGEAAGSAVQEAPASVAPIADNGGAVAEGNAEADRFGSTLAQIAAVLAALGLGGWALMALRRRKPAPKPAPRPEISVAAPPSPEVSPAPATNAAGQPMNAYDQMMAGAASRQVDGQGVAAASGAAVPLPRKMPTSFAERDVLLRRMVAAQPDRANPFVSPKARVRRARLIIQSLDRTFDREPAIDLSQYPNNWPELARRDYATAA